jgi:hypothetical protein
MNMTTSQDRLDASIIEDSVHELFVRAVVAGICLNSPDLTYPLAAGMVYCNPGAKQQLRFFMLRNSQLLLLPRPARKRALPSTGHDRRYVQFLNLFASTSRSAP